MGAAPIRAAEAVSRWLITGAAGMLGREVTELLRRAGEPVVGLTRQELDITDDKAVHACLRSHAPDVLVNCAAWTAVDDAERHEAEALRVNGHGPANLASACADHGTRMVQVSTDYVFSGDARGPYGEDDAPCPQTAYGRTKLAGEQAVRGRLSNAGYIVRTAWLYGAHGPNFVYTMKRLAEGDSAVRVVDDQRGQPTWAADVASQIIALMQSGAPAGIYHATSTGDTSWYGFAREIFRLLGADETRITPVTTAEFPRPAPRPANSVLGHDAWAAAGIKPISDWRHALERAFSRLVAAPAS